MKKILSLISVMFMGIGLFTGCNKGDCDDCIKTGDMTLDDINELINSEKFWSGYDNPVAIIPFNHIDGPKNEWKFYAIVNFQYKEATYVKYQVTYLSCTCRDPNINYWSTAYVELTTPTKPENSKIRALTFDKDGANGHYTAGFWGDSDPIPNGTTFEDLKNDFIPLLVGRYKKDIDKYNTVVEMKQEGALSQELYDSFTGASVSTNNILRMLQALFNYHAETYYAAK